METCYIFLQYNASVLGNVAPKYNNFVFSQEIDISHNITVIAFKGIPLNRLPLGASEQLHIESLFQGKHSQHCVALWSPFSAGFTGIYTCVKQSNVFPFNHIIWPDEIGIMR